MERGLNDLHGVRAASEMFLDDFSAHKIIAVEGATQGTRFIDHQNAGNLELLHEFGRLYSQGIVQNSSRMGMHHIFGVQCSQVNTFFDEAP